MAEEQAAGRGLLIVNEGPDGSGKETQTTLLCDRLAHEEYSVHRLDFPTYGTDPVADLIRELLRERKKDWEKLSWEARAMLYAANRLHYRDQLWAWLREPGAVTVLNRYVPSNLSHMAGYAEDREEWERRFAWIAYLEYDLLALPRPDIVLLNTMPPHVSDALLHDRERGNPDAHESDRSYLDRVTRCFQLLADREPDIWRRVAADVGGVVQDPATVHARVWEALKAHPVWQEFVRQRVSANITRE